MKNVLHLIAVIAGLFIAVGCGTARGPKGARQIPIAKPPIIAPAPTVARASVADAPVPSKTAVPPERIAAIIGDWTRQWLSGAPGAGYRISRKSETELSMIALEKDIFVEKMEFDGVKLSWTERGADFTEQNSARLQPDSKMFLGMSWDPAAQTGRKFRLEKE